MRKASAHRIRPEEYDEAPELTDDQLAEAVIEIGGKPVRGRPRLERPKMAIKLRIDADIVRHFRGTGPGWQTRINDTLRKATKLKAAG
ncbi:MAG TPA: BrnA antitoxin family protein [Pseudolabrys sp.]|nr:BrnA antitoxin family protein [Pseudolabrys sp.]